MKISLSTFAIAALIIAHATPGAAAERSVEADAVALVKKAVKLVQSDGADKAIAEFNNLGSPFNVESPLNKHGDLYIIAMNLDGLEVAHGKNPKMVGKNLIDLRDADGVYVQRAMLAACNSAAGSGWSNYRWPNAVTKELEKKSSYSEKVGNLCLAAGIYRK